MLKDLKILNGELELKFNEYTYEYTVKVSEDVEKLEIDYVLGEDSYIDIKNNELNGDESIVYIDVYNVDKEVTYTLHVYKESSKPSSGIDNYRKSLEVSNNVKVDYYKVELLACGIFLAIVVVFSLLFHRRKTK